MKEKGVEEVEVGGVVKGEYYALDRKRGRKTIEKVTEGEKRKLSVEYEGEIIEEKIREK